MDLTQILKDCPSGTKLYSPMFGEVTFIGINNSWSDPIIVQDCMNEHRAFTIEGKYFKYEESECMLFPSKENRNWSTFKNSMFKPFQKVLVRDSVKDVWQAQFYSHYCTGFDFPHLCISRQAFAMCIPYDGNEYLLGTKNDVKE